MSPISTKYWELSNKRDTLDVNFVDQITIMSLIYKSGVNK